MGVKMENKGDILIYQNENGDTKINVLYDKESIWLSQEKIAELFGIEKSVITKHIKNIIEIRELQEESVCAKIAHTAEDGKTYKVKFYNLDMIISVDYRVNSITAVHFRQWATKTLILKNKGIISKLEMEEKTNIEYKKYKERIKNKELSNNEKHFLGSLEKKSKGVRKQ
jgi:hypothetical protein